MHFIMLGNIFYLVILLISKKLQRILKTKYITDKCDFFEVCNCILKMLQCLSAIIFAHSLKQSECSNAFICCRKHERKQKHDEIRKKYGMW